MTTLIKHTTFFIIFIYFSGISYGQNSCDRSELVGNWKLLGGFIFYQDPNLDSLVNVIDTLKSTPNVASFNDDETYLIKIGKRTKKLYYNINEKNCKINIRRKKKSKNTRITDILLINEKHLITRHPNPKAFTINLYRRT